MTLAAGICVWNRHCLAGINTFYPNIILSRDIEEVRRDVVHPVVLAVFPHKPLAGSCSCLHGLCAVAVNTIDFAHLGNTCLCLHVFLNVCFSLMAVCAEGVFRVPYLCPQLVFDIGHSVWVVAAAAGLKLTAVPVFFGFLKLNF